MPAQDSVAEFISQNSAVIDKLKAQLDTANNKLLMERKRRGAVGTVIKLACDALTRLYGADLQLWTPLQQLATSQRTEPPRAPVPPEFFWICRHPSPEDAARLVERTNRSLARLQQQPASRRATEVQGAKEQIHQLQVETCAPAEGEERTGPAPGGHGDRTRKLLGSGLDEPGTRDVGWPG
jgi:hypothetical protein